MLGLKDFMMMLELLLLSYESDGDDNRANDGFKKGKGYHAVPPPYTGNYMPLRADLSFAGLDNFVFKSKVSETITSVPKIETNASKTSKDSLEKPKTVRNTTVENENKAEKPRKFNQSPRAAVLTKSRQVPINAAKQSSQRAATSVSTAKNVNTVVSRLNVNNALPTTYYYFKEHSPVRRPFNQKLAAKTYNFNEKFNTAKVNNITTVGPKAVASAAEGSRNNGNPQYALQDQGIFDSGCSRHMTRNKSYLIDYQAIDGGFVAFRGNAKEGGLTCLFEKFNLDESNLWHRRLGHINFKTINKLVKGNLVRGLPSKLLENDHTCVACKKGKQHKASCKTKNAEAVITACYVQNRVLVIKPHNKTHYEVLLGRKPALSFMRPFGCPVTYLNTLDHLGPKSSENEVADDAGKKSTEVLRNENGVQDQAKESDKHDQELNIVSLPVNAVSSFTTVDPGRERVQRNEFKSIFGQDKYVNDNMMFTSDSGIFSGAYDDEVKGAEADFNNLELTTVVSLIPTTRIHKDHTKEKIIRDPLLLHQTRRMTKTSQECTMMDVKSAFLYGTIEEEVYVCQPPGYEDLHFLNKVYKVEKALYGLHQAPRAWYKTLSTYLLENGFKRGIIDKTLFIKKDKGDIMLVHVYVDDIIFGSTKKSLCIEFEALMHKKFQMSSMGELTFFLGRFQVTPKLSHLHVVKRIFRYLKGQPKLGLWYPKDLPFDLEAFSNSDYARASLDRKSTTGGCQFLRKRLISWQCKKQKVVTKSSTDAEYVVVANCYGHVLWIQNQMLDYGSNFMNTKIYIDNESTIYIVKNPAYTYYCQLKVNAVMHKLTTAGDVYTSCIEQFWASAKVKNVNGEAHKKKKQRKEIEVPSPSSEIPTEEGVPTSSNDPLPSDAKTAQVKEIASLKKRVKKLEQKRKSRTLGLKRLRKVRTASRIESSPEASLGHQEDAITT
uniref:Putative ribonuclease H-like domain-containing protein n=1 Tax=Tanacetum cinerariifolium TaxID=118510 RepID=A0A6L2K1N4_TANCI|nr:putative ribonuclease H-like domain-containing protein [Tanacetum cinerariifolium]